MNSEYNETVKCHKCFKDISKPNFILHEVMCKGVRESFILNVNDPDFKNKFSDQEEPVVHHRDNTEPKPQIEKPSVIPQKKQQIQGNISMKKPPQQLPKRPSTQDRFPCSYCGYMMSMAELDTHPQKCVAHNIKCPYCQSDYPKQLLNQHKTVCQKRPREPERERPRQNPVPPRQPRNQNRIRNNSLPVSEQIEPYNRIMNYNSKSISTTIQNGHQIQKIGRRYPNGDETLEVFVDGRLEQVQHLIRRRNGQRNHPGQQQDDILFMFGNGRNQRHNAFPNIFFSSSNNVGDLNRLIEGLMAGMRINRRENPGLTEEQVKKLPVVKFNKNTNGAHSPSCTICIKDYNEGDVLIQLPCGHLFNKQCIFPWLKTSSVCPNCRNPVKVNRPSQNIIQIDD